MHTAAPPPEDLVRLLRAHGARIVSPVGTDGTWWLARPIDDDSGPWLEVLVADVPVDARTAARAGLLTDLEHPHLPTVVAVEPLEPGRVALVCEHVPGPTLAAVRAARPPLADGEVATVAVPVAQALAALHAVGVAHGAVAADRIVLRPGGVPVLVDLRSALRDAGTPTGDVHRLVASLLALLPPLDAHLASGLEGATRLRDALESLLRDRATADEVVERVFAAATPQPVLVPDADELAGAQVALATGRTGADRTTSPRPPLPRRPRARPRRRWWPVAACVAVLLAAGAVTWWPDAAPAGRADAPAASADDGALADQVDPETAAAALTRRRTAALAAADAVAVAGLTVPGSPAAAADEALLVELAGTRSDGLSVEVGTVAATGRTPDGDVTVQVTSSLSAHERVTPTGDRSTVPASPARTVELVLRWTPDGWRVWDVRQPGGPTP